MEPTECSETSSAILIYTPCQNLKTKEILFRSLWKLEYIVYRDYKFKYLFMIVTVQEDIPKYTHVWDLKHRVDSRRPESSVIYFRLINNYILIESLVLV